MAVTSSGAISLPNLQSEFGGDNPISLSEYYRNGAYVTSNNTSVPTSGAISLSNFYGALKRVTSLSIANHANTNGDLTTVTLPTGLQVGDILVVSRSSTTSSSSLPSGWTLINFAYSSNGAYKNWGSLLAYKVVTSTSESGTSVGSFGNGGNDTGATVWAIRPNIPASQINIVDTFSYAGTSSGGNTTINASDSSFCTVSLASMGVLNVASSYSSLLGTTTNTGIFRNAAGGTDPISGSQNYLTGTYIGADDEHDGNVAYAFCQTPESSVNIDVNNQSSIVNALSSAYLEVIQMPQVILTPEELEAMLDRAAKRGASAVLSELGLTDESAATDIREIRGLLETWRLTRLSIWNTFVKITTVAIFGFIATAIWMQLGNK